jgi:hypothetical protein
MSRHVVSSRWIRSALRGALVPAVAGAMLAACQPADGPRSSFNKRPSAISHGDDDRHGGGDRGGAVVPPNAEAFGTTYADLAGAWWSWGIGIKATGDPATNPILSDGAVDCSLGQRGSVWFLAGNFGGVSARSCRVPSGKALFIPMLNSLFIRPDEGATTEIVRGKANAQSNTATVLQAEIDGRPVGDAFAYRAQSPPGGFALKVEKGSLLNGQFGFTTGDRRGSVADGHWLLIKPLSRGPHVVHVAGKLGDPAAPDFELDVTYEITVGGHD